MSKNITKVFKQTVHILHTHTRAYYMHVCIYSGVFIKCYRSLHGSACCPVFVFFFLVSGKIILQGIYYVCVCMCACVRALVCARVCVCVRACVHLAYLVLEVARLVFFARDCTQRYVWRLLAFCVNLIKYSLAPLSNLIL